LNKWCTHTDPVLASVVSFSFFCYVFARKIPPHLVVCIPFGTEFEDLGYSASLARSSFVAGDALELFIGIRYGLTHLFKYGPAGHNDKTHIQMKTTSPFILAVCSVLGIQAFRE
jgi:hypothetical protein